MADAQNGPSVQWSVAAFHDVDATRLELAHREVDDPFEYGTKRVVATITAYCAGLEEVVVQLDRDQSLEFASALVDGFEKDPTVRSCTCTRCVTWHPETPTEGGAGDGVAEQGEAGRDAAAPGARDGADSQDVGPATSEEPSAAEEGGPGEPRARSPLGFAHSTPLWHAVPDDTELLELLTAAACPAPCVGVRDPGGEDWHAQCEKRARAALQSLRGFTDGPSCPPHQWAVDLEDPTSFKRVHWLGADYLVCARCGTRERER